MAPQHAVRLCLTAAFLLTCAACTKDAPSNAPQQATTTSPSLDKPDIPDLPLDQFRPQSMLRVSEHLPPRAKFPAVDVHVHPRIKMHHSAEALDELVARMDEQNIAVCVSLDGGLGALFDEHAEFLWNKHRNRFVIFANIDWQGGGRRDDTATWDFHRPDFGRRMALALADAKSRGASGLKIFKDLGLVFRNLDHSFVRIDDERWDPIWTACGELSLPVLIHAADPAAFFLPIDQRNERWEELKRHPEWSFYGAGRPSREEVLAQFLRVVKRHPRTTFIAAHLANSAEDLVTLSQWLDENPNLYVDLAARINELGRQPYTARDFLLKYADRIVLGTDGPRTSLRLQRHWQFLETRDEYFPYSEEPFPPQGLWNIYGVHLPDEVLKKIYYQNAATIIPHVREKWEATTKQNSR